MFKNITPKIIAISIIALIAVATIDYVFYLTRPLKILKNYTIPTEFMFDNQRIALAWTDDNDGETLIIQSDKKEYNGFSSVDVYFSITNISNMDQDMDVAVWVGNEKVRVEEVEKINSDENQKTTSEEMVLSASAGANAEFVNYDYSIAENKKSANMADSLESQNDSTSSDLTSNDSIAYQNNLSNNQKTTSEEMANGLLTDLPVRKPDKLNYIIAYQNKTSNSNRKSINGFTTGYFVNDQIESGQTNYYKATIKYPPMSKGEFFIEAFGRKTARNEGSIVPAIAGLWSRYANTQEGDKMDGLHSGSTAPKGDYGADTVFTYGHLDPWYSSNWSYKRQITINASQIATTTSAFPVLATTTLADLKTTTNGGKVGNDNGYDIIFVDDDDSTLLNFEREKYASTTGEIAYWIKMDISSTTDKTIYMYYGNASATDQATTTGVWDNNYVMVNHLANDGVATTTYPDFLDSTLYDNDGSSVNMNSADLVDGQIDGSLDFDGVDDYVGIADSSEFDLTGNFTVSGWINMNSANSQTWFGKWWDGTTRGYIFAVDASGDLILYSLLFRSPGDISDTLIKESSYTHSPGQWQHVNWIHLGGDYTVYVNGVTLDGPQAGGGFDTNSQNIHIGKAGHATLPTWNIFNGSIDEVRTSNVARTAGWISTEYNNQSDVGSFLVIGAEEDNVPTEFVSKIRAAGNGGDFNKLSTWEAAVQTDLTATTTRVYSGSLTGTLSYDDTVELFRDGTYLNITASVIATSTGGQMLVDGITGANYDLVAQSGDQWRLASSTINMWTITGTTGDELGDTAIAVAECYNDWPSGLDDRVTIGGWGTNATNYIKVHAPDSERHNGTAGSGFKINYTGTGDATIKTYEYVTIDGLEFTGRKEGSDDVDIQVEEVFVIIKNNIIHDNNASSFASYQNPGAISIQKTNAARIYNSIIYNITNIDGSKGYGISGYSGQKIYNNIVYNCIGTGIGGGFAEVKNNISINNGTDFGSGSTLENNNISSDSTAPGTGSLTNQSLSDIAFVSTTSGSEDLHIQSSSVAKGAGADLSSTFTTDIDGQTRLGAWDIGADEFNEITHLIRKTYTIGASTGDISRSSNMVTVNLTTEHDNLKVGQTIKVWDVDDSTFDGYFTIASVASTTQFTYAQTGDDANSANGSVGGDYELLSTWEAAQQRDLVEAQQIEVAECYNDWKTTGLADHFSLSGWTTSATNYVKIYTPTSERHDGTAIDGSNYTGFAIKMDATWTFAVSLNNYARFDGIIIDLNDKTGADGMYLSDGTYIENSIIFNSATGRKGIFIYGYNSINYINNCLVYDVGTAFYGNKWNRAYVYNCTAKDSTTGFYKADTGYGLVIKNCLADGNTTDFNLNGSANTISYSASSDGTADDFGGAGNRINQTFSFVDEANDDFHLAGTDAGARNQGTDLSADANYPFSTDIDNDTRPYGGVWDIGADEASGYAVTQLNSPWTSNNNWYNSNWKYKRAITLNASQIATTTSNFPILATATLPDLKSYAHDGHVGNSNGYDIIFVDDDNTTLLNFEREKYVPSTGEIVYWIKTDISSTTDKTIYMYYGNSGASDQATTTGVWDDNFVAVQHLNENPEDTSPAFKDSTINNNNGTDSGSMTSSDSVDGKIGGAIDFDGGNDVIKMPSSASFNAIDNSSQVTMEAWFLSTATGAGGDDIISTDRLLGYHEYTRISMYTASSPNDPYFKANLTIAGETAKTSSISAADNQWHHVVGVFDSTDIRIFVNGASGGVATTSADTLDDWSGWGVRIGGGPAGSNDFLGKIDEVRISNVARTAGWISTEYNNQSDVNAFMTFGTEENLNRTAQANSPITNYLTDGLVGHWTFNGPDMDWASTTAEALDMSGNSNNGNVIGAKAAIGKVGQGLEFDGVDDYVDVGNGSNIVSSLPITVSAWIYNEDTASTFSIFASNDNADAALGNYYGVWVKINSTAHATCSYGDGTGAGSADRRTKTSADTINQNEWYHIVSVIKGATDMNIYINAVDAGGAYSGTGGGLATNTWNARIGRKTRYGPFYANGLIDEVRVYNRAFSADEVGELYRMGARRFQTN